MVFLCRNVNQKVRTAYLCGRSVLFAYFEFYRLRKLNWVAYCKQVLYRDSVGFLPLFPGLFLEFFCDLFPYLFLFTAATKAQCVPRVFCDLFPNLFLFTIATQAIFVRVLKKAMVFLHESVSAAITSFCTDVVPF